MPESRPPTPEIPGIPTPAQESMGILTEQSYKSAVTTLKLLTAQKDIRFLRVASSLKILTPQNLPKAVGISVLLNRATELVKPAITDSRAAHALNREFYKNEQLSDDEIRLRVMAQCALIFGESENLADFGIQENLIANLGKSAIRWRSQRRNLTEFTYPSYIADLAHIALLDRTQLSRFGVGDPEKRAFIEKIIKTQKFLLTTYGLTGIEVADWGPKVYTLGNFAIIDPRLRELLLLEESAYEILSSKLQKALDLDPQDTRRGSTNINSIVNGLSAASRWKFLVATPSYPSPREIQFAPPSPEYPVSVIRY